MTRHHLPALLLAAALALPGTACRPSEGGGHGRGGERPRRARVIQGDVVARVLLTGELRAAASADLTAPRTDAWELPIRWMVEDGTAVKQGERVLEFDNSAFTSQIAQKTLAVLQAQTDLRSARDVGALAIADKEADLRQKQALRDKADLLAGRTAQERQLELMRAEAAVAAARSELAAQREATALDQKVKQIELDKVVRSIEDSDRAMRELVLTAPHDGVVMVGEHPWEERPFRIGDVVQPGWRVASFPDTSRGLEVSAELSDVEDGRVAIGDAGSCTLDAYPEHPLPCKVSELTPVARSSARKSLRRAFDVTLALDPAEGVQVRPGMSVKIELRRPLATGAVVVPRGALVRGGEGTRVQVPGGTREVVLGPCDAQGCVVERGLAAGDAVVIGGGG
jgi:HlyD family secretion protein